MSPSTHFPLELIVRCGGRQVARCVVKRGRYILGQEERCEVVIDEPSISGRHARLTLVSESEILLEDLGSANGTLVDGVPAEKPLRLDFTSLVQLGNATLEFLRGGLPAAVFEYLPATFLHPRRHELREPIARGGVSTIYEARDLALDRPVAVRVMQPPCQRSAVTVIRFIREAQIMAQLQHPYIPPVYELRVNHEGQLFYSTRMLEGESLASLLERTPLPALLMVWQKVCDAVAYAHARGVIHCALRPENIIVGQFGEVLVLGWTFAALMATDLEGAEPAGWVRAPGEASTAAITAYTAPELASDTGIFDERADLYSLGAILYALLTGHPPFEEADERLLTRQILGGSILPPSKTLLPVQNVATEKLRAGLGELAMRALSGSAESRPSSVLALQAEATAWQNGTAGGEPGRRWAGLGGLLVKR